MNTNYFLKQSTKKNILLIFIIPILVQLVLINLAQSIGDLWLYYLLFVFFTLLYLPYFYWLKVAVNFLFFNSNTFRLTLNKFKVSLVINVIMMFNFVFFIAYMFRFVFSGGEPNDLIFLCVGLIQFVGISSFSYTNYFVSKLLATIDLKRNVGFSDIVGNFVAFSFPPFAVWVIHKKIKSMQ